MEKQDLNKIVELINKENENKFTDLKFDLKSDEIDIWTETYDYMSSVELSKIIKYVDVVDRHWLIGMHDYLETVVLHIY